MEDNPCTNMLTIDELRRLEHLPIYVDATAKTPTACCRELPYRANDGWRCCGCARDVAEAWVPYAPLDRVRTERAEGERPRCTRCGREYAPAMTIRTTTLCPDCLTREITATGGGVREDEIERMATAMRDEFGVWVTGEYADVIDMPLWRTLARVGLDHVRAERAEDRYAEVAMPDGSTETRDDLLADAPKGSGPRATASTATSRRAAPRLALPATPTRRQRGEYGSR